MALKKCVKCGLEKPLDIKHFKKVSCGYKVDFLDTCLECENKKKEVHNKKREFDYSAKEWEETLEHFNYRDAYTGQPLNNSSKDHIIPISKGGGTVRENIIPCDYLINTSKGNREMEEWFREQEFFSEKRLNKIKEWSSNYEVRMKEIDTDQQSFRTIYHYTIPLPNGDKRKLYYDYHQDPRIRTLTIKDVILDRWEDWIAKNWLHLGKIDPFRFNGEDKVKNTLGRCAGYITNQDRDDRFKVLNKSELEKIYTSEMPLSATNSDVAECFYSGGDFNEDETCGDTNIMEIEYGDFNKMNNTKRVVKSYKQTRISKYERIFTNDIINNNLDYTSEWCNVNVDGTFIFDGKVFKVLDKALEYQPINHELSDGIDDLMEFDMDKVLGFVQNGSYIFYNQEIDTIEVEYEM